MAFSLKSLAKIATGAAAADGSPPLNIWMYVTADAMTGGGGVEVREATYFNGAVNLLKVGDIMIIVTAWGGTLAPYISYVISNDGTDVDLANGVAITATDSD